MTDAWQIIEDVAEMGYRVRIHGEYVTDGETGKPAIYFAPRCLRGPDEFNAWKAQLFRSIERMSGVPVQITA